jgi:hypothetical protein
MAGLLATLDVASAGASGLDLRMGAFWPRTKSNLFDDVSDLYLHNGERIGKGDWTGFAGGFEYNFVPTRNVEVGVHLDGYSRTLDTVYREFDRPGGREIEQTLKLTIVPVGATVRFVPTSRRARIAPYVAVGADLFIWKYEEAGDFIDFFDPDFPISSDAFASEGVTGGFHVAAGVRIPLNPDFSIVGEAKYQYAKRTNMGDDFSNNDIDLSGVSATVGIHLRF